MRYFRALFRTIAFSAATAGLYLVWLCGAPFVASSTNVSQRWRQFIFRTWARVTAGIVRMRLNVKGRPPQGSFLLVANHLSYIDIIALASCTNCMFVAKSEVARWPLIGLLARSMKTIFIDRKSRQDVPTTLVKIESSLVQGAGVVIFAEGTSTEGNGVAPFRPSLLEVAARRGVPVHYASLSYRTPDGEPPASQSVCWWGDMTFLKHLFVLFQLSEFEAHLSFGAEPILANDRKVLARELWSAVNAQFTPVT